MTADPPLGRYDDAATDPDEALYEVRLIGLPVGLLAAGRRHHEDLLHEMAMLAVSDTDASSDVPKRFADLVELLGTRYAATTRRRDEQVEAAIAAGLTTVDLTYTVPGHVVTAADQLADLMREADDYCRSTQLLTLPRSDLQVRFAQWYLDEFRRQVRGEAPTAWDGPLDEPGAAPA